MCTDLFLYKWFAYKCNSTQETMFKKEIKKRFLKCLNAIEKSSQLIQNQGYSN